MQEIVTDFGKVEDRRACVVQTENGLRVDLYEYKNFIRSVDLNEHNLLYAESLAKNWTNRLIKK